MPNLPKIVAEDRLLSAFDVDIIRPKSMLFQVDYLTIE